MGYSDRVYCPSSTNYGLSTGPWALGTGLHAEEEMRKFKRTKYVHEGKYVAEVEIETLEDEEGWSPYLSLQGAYRLDDVREALHRSFS